MPVSENAGVVDAGVILTRLDRRRRSHAAAVALFDSCARGALRLHMSTVNLAEALQRSRAYREATGVDVVAILRGLSVVITPPDVDVARRVSELSALATTQAFGARLHTTDRVLAQFARRCHVPTTLY